VNRSDAITYCGPAPTLAELGGRWNFDPWLLLAFALALFVWRWHGARAVANASTLRLRRRAFPAALAVLAVAFISPLCAATVALFSARTVHHVLLVAVAAPLLALAFAQPRASARSPTLPLAVAIVVFYAWHAPPLYSAALAAPSIYWAMQATLLGSAVWFWARVLHPAAEPVASLTAILATAALMGLLGALLTFAPRPLYVEHFAAPFAFGLTPLDDQRLAGLIMWVPALAPYLAAAGWIARRRWAAAAVRVTA
jgi:putative membrane protein